MSFSEIAEHILYNFLTDPDIDEKIKQLEQMPMTCLACHTKGLVQIGEPRIEKRHYYYTKDLVDTELIDYICPTCNAKHVKYNHARGGGINLV